MARDDPDAALFLFRQNLTAATDAAIVLRGECRKPRVCGAMVLVLLCIFVVAGAHNIQCRTFVLSVGRTSKKPRIGVISEARHSVA